MRAHLLAHHTYILSSFGNAISQGLMGEVGYAYDALNGGFKYDMAQERSIDK